MVRANKADFVFTSGAVTRGHPDKLCDVISDTILDAFLIQDPATRLVAECAVSSGVLFLATRVASQATIELTDIVRGVVADAGYVSGDFNAEDCSVMLSQAPFLAYALLPRDLRRLDKAAAAEIPASNQTTLFGYACRQTDNYMPYPIELANRLARRLDAVRLAGELSYLTPDCQVQVAIAYLDDRPLGIESINVLATQFDAERPAPGSLRDDLIQAVVEPVLAEIRPALDFDPTHLVVNPAGVLVGGGPVAHSGMTGRKTGMDTYGGFARQSAAALSGKDPIRIDRSGSYAARYVARHVVAAKLADECEIQLSYSVGQPRPVGLRVRTFGGSSIGDDAIAERIGRVFDLRPGIIAQQMGLQQLAAERGGFYRHLAAYGHMGREDIDTPWERLDRVDELKSA